MFSTTYMPLAWLLAHLFCLICAASTDHRVAEIGSGGELLSDSAHERLREEASTRLQHQRSIEPHIVEISSTGHLKRSHEDPSSSSSSSPHKASARKRERRPRIRDDASRMIRKEAKADDSHTSKHAAHGSPQHDGSSEGTLYDSLDEEELGEMPRAKRDKLIAAFLDEEDLDVEDDLLLSSLVEGALRKKGPPPQPARRRAVDCSWQQWTAWGTCTTTCGYGTWMRYRGMNLAQYGGEACYGEYQETDSCHPRHCPVHCKWGEWSGLTPSTCPVTCGGGLMVTSRYKISEPQYGGTQCNDPGLTSLNVACNSQPCPIDCDFGAWTVWTSCSISCGVGMQQRSRDKLHSTEHGGAQCPGLASETRQCNTRPCPIDCGVGGWTEWGQCSEDCGGGKTTRFRSKIVHDQHGGEPCPHLEEAVECNDSPCAPPIKAKGRSLAEISVALHILLTTGAFF